MIDDLGKFLRGHTAPIVARLRAEMQAASNTLEFEKAAAVRDQLLAIERVVEKQKIISAEQMDSDVIAFARDDRSACVQIFFVRAGKLIGREYFVLEGAEEAADDEVVTQFVKQFYDEAAYIPAEVILPGAVPEAEVIGEWLRDKRSGEKVVLTVPRQGAKKDLVQMAAENAADTLASLKAQWEADTNRQTQALAELQAALNLPRPPNRLECFDISNTQGVLAVASMVVFEQGTPRKGHYRHFNIKTVEGPDDFASMRETLTRRFQRWQTSRPDGPDAGSAPAPGRKVDESFARLPDLLVIDGGQGQLGVAVEVLQAFGLFEAVPVCALAKQQEELFQPGASGSILLPRRSQGLFLVQRLRDEAHRFGLEHHRARRAKVGIASQLDSVPGIGPARRRALLRKFGSLDGIRAASLEELLQVPGMTRAAAEAVKAHL